MRFRRMLQGIRRSFFYLFPVEDIGVPLFVVSNCINQNNSATKAMVA